MLSTYGIMLSTYGSKNRVSAPKTSQTIQLDRTAATQLRDYIERVFPGS